MDDEIVVDALSSIDRYSTDLKEMRGLSREEYLANTVQQRAVERTFMNLIQSCIDLSAHLRAGCDLGPAETSREEIEALGRAGIVSTDTQEKLEEAVGFRNVLAHRYGDLDHDVVYDVLHEDVHWFERFGQEIAAWYRDRA